MQPHFQHKGKDTMDVQITRQKVVDPGLLQALMVVSPNAPTGPYSLSLVDGDGATNGVPFEVTQ
jgi:hypothetical protein